MVYGFNLELFTERFQELRNLRGLTKFELAKAIGISHVSVGRWESGVHIPNIEHLHTIASFFNVDSDYLIGRKDAPR